MFVIWGYDPATKVCHGYGPYADQASVDAAAAKAKAIWPIWTVTVAAVTPLSAKYPQAAPATWMLWAQALSFGGAGLPSAYLSSDPAALDALGSAKQASGAAFNYQVLALEGTLG